MLGWVLIVFIIQWTTQLKPFSAFLFAFRIQKRKTHTHTHIVYTLKSLTFNLNFLFFFLLSFLLNVAHTGRFFLFPPPYIHYLTHDVSQMLLNWFIRNHLNSFIWSPVIMFGLLFIHCFCKIVIRWVWHSWWIRSR